MAQLALYREFRPATFDDVVAQQHVVFPLRQSIRLGTVSHALLFSGTRGTGKTSLAKIYAKAINCEQPVDGNPCNQCAICRGANDGSLLDILEMDAASHNSVENIRKMTDEVIYTPVQARYKVYIIDEAHMLSGGAFNALLKTLEEPPAHAVFILATTEPHRIPATILSRCQRYDFRRIALPDLEERLRLIAERESISIDAEALRTIAVLGDGALRDAISLLDQVSQGAGDSITRSSVLDLVGIVQDDVLLDLLAAILEGRPAELLTSLESLAMSGRDLTRIAFDLSRRLRDLLLVKLGGEATRLIELPDDTVQRLSQLARNLEPTQLVALTERLSHLLSDLRWAGDVRTTLEIGLLGLSGQALQPTTSLPQVKQEGKAKQADTPPPAKQTAVTTKPQPQKTVPTKQEKTAVTPKVTKQAEAGKATASTVQKPEETLPVEEEAEMTPAEADSSTYLLGVNAWGQVMERLMTGGEMALYLMAKPAHASYDGKVFTLAFTPGYESNRSMLSERDHRERIKALLQEALNTHVSLDIVLSDVAGEAQGEELWLRTLRDRLEQDESLLPQAPSKEDEYG